MDKLVEFATVEPDILENDYKRCFKYPFMATEALCLKNETLTNSFLSLKSGDEDRRGKRLLQIISVLRKGKFEDEINPTISGYVSRIVENLVHNFPEKIIEFIYSKDIVEDILFKELEDFSVVNIILKTIALQLSNEQTLKGIDTHLGRRSEILMKLLDELAALKIDHKGTIFEQSSRESSWIITNEEIKIKNIGLLFSGLIRNLNSLYEKKKVAEFLSSAEFLGKLLESAHEVIPCFYS